MRKNSDRVLIRQMKAYFPDRWEVSRIDSNTDGEVVSGTIKIHCLEDDKMFLSDFSAKLDGKGSVKALTLDGVAVGKFIGRLHSR